MSGTVAIVVFVVGLVVSIMVHEWGHFATARRFGMRADRFFLGFGPTVWSTQVGETEYGVKALPLGGFVRIAGMSPVDERQPGVPAALAERIDDGADPVTAFARLLDERGTPSAVAERLVRRYEAILDAGPVAAAGAPAGLDAADLQQPTADGASDQRGRRRDQGGVDPVLLAVEVIESEVVPTGRVGDLHHRLTRGDEGRFFTDRPAWQRTIVLASGSVLHFAQAIVIIFLGWLLVGQTVVVPVVASFAAAERPDGTVVPSAAEEAGIQVGDRILAVDGTMSEDFEELRRVIRENPGEPVPVTVERAAADEVLRLTITPAAVEDPETGETIGLLGFLPETDTEPLEADQALYRTFVGAGSFPDMLVGTFTALGSIFGPEGISGIFSQVAGEAERDPAGAISLVGAADVAGQGTEAFGALFLFGLLAAVNVFIGIFNALPLPPLDGGHIAVLGVERAVNAVRRAQGRVPDFTVDPRTVAAIALPVIGFVVTISLALVYLDITNPLTLE